MERLDDHALSVYTDGSSYESPRRGGYAFLFVTTGEDGEEVVHQFSPNGCPDANSQEMELKAVAEALKLAGSQRSPVDLSRFSKVEIFTDSTTVHGGFGAAKFEWSKSRWMRKSGPPVLHADLWKEVVAAIKRLRMPVHVNWVRGKGNRHTKLVHKLAQSSAQRPFSRPVTVRTVRRKRTSRSVDPGSVPAEGQELEIQIITAEYLRVQRCLRYKYEVMSEGPHLGSVDFVFSDEALKTRYIYRVRFNEDPAYPRIDEVIARVGPAERSADTVE